MKNILLINYEYPPIGAGAANATFHIAEALARLDVHPIVVTAAYGKHSGITDCRGVTLIRIPARRAHPNKSNLLEMASFMLNLARRIGGIQKQHRIDAAIIFFSFPCGPIGLILRYFHGIHYVVSLRGGDVPGTEPGLRWLYWLLTPLRRMVLKNSQAVIANSKGLADLSIKADPVPVRVIPNGVDTDFWHQQHAIEDHTGTLTLLFVGRFHRQKNLPLLLEAFMQFQNKKPNSQLILVGDGPDRQALEKSSPAKAVSTHITWCGWVDKSQLRTLYQKADCLVNPSHYEGMPNVLLEAMASGTPVIASDVPGNNAVIEHGVTGRLFTPDSALALQTCLISLAEDNAWTDKMAKNAQRMAIKDYTWQSVGAQYLSCLADMPTARFRVRKR